MGQDGTKVGRDPKNLQKNGMSFMDVPFDDFILYNSYKFIIFFPMKNHKIFHKYLDLKGAQIVEILLWKEFDDSYVSEVLLIHDLWNIWLSLGA